MQIESLRFKNKFQFSFVQEALDQNLYMPPMLVQPIIENCFIYSDIESNKEAYITLDLLVENKVLILKTENSTSEKKHSIEKKISGIGINNVNSYYWITDVTNNQYAVPNYLTGRQINARLLFEF